MKIEKIILGQNGSVHDAEVLVRKVKDMVGSVDLTSELLDSIVALQDMDDYGFFPLLEVTGGMPGEEVSYFNRVPSYYLLAMLIKGNTNGKYDDAIYACLEGCKKSKFYGYGYEEMYEQYTNMAMLLKAGILDYADKDIFEILYTTYAQAKFRLYSNDTLVGFGDIHEQAITLVEAWESVEECVLVPIFVYGTLMKGNRAHSYLENAAYCGNYILENYGMYNLGSFPGIVPLEGEKVVGEVYLVDYETIPEMDMYETEMYKRESVLVYNYSSIVEVEVYVFQWDVSNYSLVQSKWNMKDNEYVWYACYGSNLLEERFRYYIEGGYFPVNGRTYSGCSNTKLWKETELVNVKGELYFAKRSPSWNKQGVAFFDPKGDKRVFMKLYKITFGQLKEVMEQEGGWYSHMDCVGLNEDGLPIYTLTSKERFDDIAPCKEYLQVIEQGLLECGLDNEEVMDYLEMNS